MVFAAGFGTRMGSLTRDRPKPMIRVAGRPLIDHALEQVRGAGIPRTVVNVHYLPEQIQRHLAPMADVTVVREEPDILDTGGGLRNALAHLGQGPVFTLNSDYAWSGANALASLAAAWEPDRMDGLLLMLPRGRAEGHGGEGDFRLLDDGRLAPPRPGGPEALVYAGAQIIRTARLAEIPETVFSVTRLWDMLCADGRLFGTVYPGRWVDVGRPEGIDLADRMLRSRHGA